MPLPRPCFGMIRSNAVALVMGGTLGLATTAAADTVDRWTGPYGGLVLGYGSGTAKSGAAGTPGTTTRACNVGGTTYALGQGTAFAAGSFITQFAALPGVGADVSQHPNPGQFIPATGFGLVPTGPCVHRADRVADRVRRDQPDRHRPGAAAVLWRGWGQGA